MVKLGQPCLRFRHGNLTRRWKGARERRKLSFSTGEAMQISFQERVLTAEALKGLAPFVLIAAVSLIGERTQREWVKTRLFAKFRDAR